MNVNLVQKEIVDRYFNHLRQFGYMDSKKVSQVMLAVLLIDTLGDFGSFITEDFKQDIDRIMRNLNCCNCAIPWDNIEATTTKPFHIFIPTGVIEPPLEPVEQPNVYCP